MSLVKCSTILVAIKEAPPYVALSYAWGDPSVTKEVLLDEKRVEVTASLESALRHLKNSVDSSLALWVDYLCIDQGNEVEKAQQVSHMRDIYATASRVVVWLGVQETIQDIGLAIDWIDHFGDRAHRLGIGRTPARVLRKLLSPTDDHPSGAVEELDQRDISDFVESLTTSLDASRNPHYERLMAALQGFLSVAYWRRIWVVQEFTVATSHEFICGSRSFDFMCLHYALRVLRNFKYWQLTTTATEVSQQHHLIDHKTAIPIDTRCAMSLFKTYHDGKSDLMLLLSRFTHFKSSDPRDRIFALLGIAGDAGELGIVPDYTKTCAQVYTEAARALVEHGFFDIFSYCIYPHIGPQNMQSWVPDWSRVQTRYPLQERITKVHKSSWLQPDFHASKHLGQPTLHLDKTGIWNTALQLQTIEVCTVTAVGSPWETEGHGKWLHSLQVLAMFASPYTCDHDKTTHAIWSTALAGQQLRKEDTKPRISAETIVELDRAVGGKCLSNVTSSTLVNAGMASFAEAMQVVGHGRRTFSTSTGKLGCGPQEIQVGDVIVIVTGAQVPCVVRKRTDIDRYLMLGEAYVHGYMDGEAVDSDAIIDSLLLC
ncbi:hypothetical protein M409DRAFT_58660 [Zasmidium cellare ATCC 36951]|uniref:Heterokaryon incompatibility domain-containing protein n=1 Tax=Zasmidium cellare ATCC 36951 TaxID=1080233 RepID=A0A6A6C897_ZASCE|nr:uncharacterized protein M409DRAFT_58660 [Zasmidium cellare ATCC 36951]KAF2161879.1 hypothetical protein M409DRAFT_58660 [Zasmidium cellare ATCC 36951]